MRSNVLTGRYREVAIIPDSFPVRVTLPDVYDRLVQAYSPQHWWPADSAFEMIVGAFLVQNTAWTNAERAIGRLRDAGRLSPEAMQETAEADLAELIRPSGFFRQKARRLKSFVTHLSERHGGSLDALFNQDPLDLRRELLGLHGVGPETADSIVLYAARKPIFVVDAYTRRLFDRLGILPAPSYDTVQRLAHATLPGDTTIFNEFHALIVRHSIVHCRATPRCGGCPLLERCASGGGPTPTAES